MSTILDTVRQPLANAFAGVSANVYAWVPEAPQVPFVVTVPDSPYIELETINKSTLHMKVNLTISVAVAYNSNPASLDNLEQLVISVLKVIQQLLRLVHQIAWWPISEFLPTTHKQTKEYTWQPQ